jgi:hypothetical protein
MRRRTLLVVLAGLAVVIAAGAVVLWPQTEPNRITSENCDRIKEGMSRAEVETILGPPGDYRTGPTQGVVQWELNGERKLNGERTTWHDQCSNYSAWVGDTGWVKVEFNNRDATVWASDFFESKRIAQHPLDNLIWRAKRQWHRWFPE